MKYVLSVLLTTLLCVCGNEDGFTFDTPEELNTDLLPSVRKFPDSQHYQATVGKIFHLVLPNLNSKRGYVAKQQTTKHLPHWLIFNKKTGTFWGIPLPGDEATLHIVVTSLDDDKDVRKIDLHVLNSEQEDNAQCKSDEERTILRLLIDKQIRAIKPRQRIIAVNNIARYFKMPYGAFTIKPQLDQDDITDSSVVLAGPGNLQSRTSKATTYLEVMVGCDGRLWESTAPFVQNLKQQARDGTITEVLGLPLIGWRVKTDTEPVIRNKRQTVEDYGSGDYDDDDYYDEYDDYNEEDDLGNVETNPPGAKKSISSPGTTTTTTSTTSTTTTPVPSSTHPHRHHHGETKPSMEYDPDEEISVGEDELPETPRLILPAAATTTEAQQEPELPGPTKFDIPKPASTDLEYDYDAYDDDDDDGTDEDQVESETIVPDLVKKTEQTSPTTTELQTAKKILDELESEDELTTVPFKTTTSTTTTTTTISTTEVGQTTFEIAEDTEPPTFVVIPGDLNTPAVTMISTTPEASSPTTTSTSSTPMSPTVTASSTSTSESSTAPETMPTTQPSTTSTTGTIAIEYQTTERDSSTSTTMKHSSSTTVTEEIMVAKTDEPLERFVPEPRNTKPYIEKRLQYKSVTAGKVFRYVIPKNTFKDAEDGYNLTIQVLDANEQPLPRTSWLQFNPSRKELYGLPLPDDVSNWIYNIRAIDKEGAYEQDQLTVQVQQHRLERVVNHEFVVQLRIEKPQEYPHYVDWSLKILRALGRVYNTNMSEITVRHINYTTEPVLFAWSNDSLATSYCPKTEITELFKMLTANDRGDPSRELSLILAPDLRIKKVVNKDLTTCEQQPVAPVTPSTNFSPILRNPVDKVNATLGELLVYKVKDDTFYDPEDVDPSTLNITLLTSDLSAIPPNSWLQFDSKNREFFGIPRKTGRTEYFLLCVDTGGMSAQDSLEVVVHPATKRQYNVEFSMTIEVPYEVFSNSAVMQRKFVEKLMEIFEESTPNNFHFLPFKAKRESTFDSTLVYWFNKSLSIDTCPTDEIKQIESLLHSESRSISRRVLRIMGPDFTVSTIKVHHIGNCKLKPPMMPTPDVAVPSEETTPPHAENDVMITLILPIIIIAIMLFVAILAACILYRKKKIGKMNVEEDGRQSYGNKGIPVIFQEELEEKPEPGTKAPVILKDEKPPLAPPEYSKSGSVKLEDSEPYQPPPPFTRSQDNGRQPRPKPTPTYRKPPPYVPP